MARKVSERARQRLRELEGLPGGRPALQAYRDGGGVATLGYGHTRGVVMGQTCTEDQAERWLALDLRIYELCVDNAVKVELNDNQFDALVLFAFNIGTAAFESSTLLRLLNKGNYTAVPEQMMRWVKDQKIVKGKKVTVTIDGLVNRRVAEIAIWCEPVAAAAPAAPVEPGMAVPPAPAPVAPPKPAAPVAPPKQEKVLSTSTGKAQASALAAGSTAAAIEAAKQVAPSTFGDTIKGIIHQLQPLVGSAEAIQGLLVACTLGLIAWTLWDRRRKLKEGR